VVAPPLDKGCDFRKYAGMAYLEPARTVVEKLGGIDEAAKAAKVDRTRVFRWMKPKIKGGTGGTIPSWHHQTLLDWARANNRPLKPEDFFARREARRRRPNRRGEPRTAAA